MEMKRKTFCDITFILFLLKNCYGWLLLMAHAEDKFCIEKKITKCEKRWNVAATILYHECNLYIMETKTETNSNKRKTYIYSWSRRKLVHASHISTQQQFVEGLNPPPPGNLSEIPVRDPLKFYSSNYFVAHVS